MSLFGSRQALAFTTIAVGLPHFPRRSAGCTKTLQLLLVFEGVHACPEAVVRIANQLLLCYESVERLDYELLFVVDVLENLLFEGEKSSVDPYIPIINGMNLGDQATVSLVQRNQVIAEVRPNTEKAGDLAVLMKVVQLLGKGHGGKAVAIVRQKFLFPFQILLNRLQALADIGIDPRVRERDAPIMDIAIEQLEVFVPR